MTVRGAVVLPVKANKATPSLEIATKATKGKQKVEGFVEEPKAALEVSGAASEEYESVGLTLLMNLETEEPLELNTVA